MVLVPALIAGIVVLPVVLPPLLFAATQRVMVGQFRDAAGPVGTDRHRPRGLWSAH